MRIGIVIPVYAGFPEPTFDSVVKTTRHEVRWYVHCNRSDATMEEQLHLFQRSASVSLHLHGWNTGVARSWNSGIHESYGDGNTITIVINDDIIFIEDGFERFVEFIGTNDEYGLGLLHGVEAFGSPHAGERRKQDYACFAYGRSAYHHVGAFDENFYPAYYEDSDYSIRFRAHGLQVNIDERTLVTHERNKSSRQISQLRTHINAIKAANLAYFERKWGSPPGGYHHSHPFQDPAFDYTIKWDERRAPYGSHDRKPWTKSAALAQVVVGLDSADQS